MKARAHYRSEEDDDRAIWEMVAGSGAPFVPVDSGKVSGWLRLAASTAVSSEWPTVVDVLNAGSPMTSSGVRIAAVGSSANGLPTMVFDGTDVHLWPLSPAHSSTTKVGIWFDFKPASVAGFQLLYDVEAGVSQGGATASRLRLFTNGTGLVAQAYLTNANGRSFSVASALTNNTWHRIYLQYDSSRGGDANLALFVGGVSLSLTASNIGAGGTLGALQVSAGAALIGGDSDIDAGSNPIANGGQIGPNIFAFNDNLTAGEIANMLLFEAPT